ncbi:ABC-2 type transporter [Coriobacterium glomerans PW2]|uniref:ABC-2 type transporter n=1 Tax=Coriobacterium glomerans (strain ATCC 49209 / DSM 20642 / JCM 10262 / PW2) TaxID=700015 RepID=F2NAA8_CORGP|nr:ABC transporter permease [Coriobacterium glomerans]AEB06294.1 ABC-2 type transporter [Coriobacterium glomerans PW2]
MNIFRCALRIVMRHKIYLMVYAGFLAILVMVQYSSSDASKTAGPTNLEARVAVVDRDGSALSRGLIRHIGRMCTRVSVADDPFELQDAIATQLIDCVIIVPKGFEKAFTGAVRQGDDLPEVEADYGSFPQVGSLVSQGVSRWLSLAAASLSLRPGASVSEISDLASDAARAHADVHEVRAVSHDGDDAPVNQLSSISFAVSAAVIVCGGLALVTLGRRGVRQRMCAAPVGPARLSAFSLLACALVTVMICAYFSFVILGPFGPGVGADTAGPAQIALALSALFAFSLTPLAIAFLLAQLGVSELGLNAAGNTVSFLMPLLGGIWMPVSFMGGVTRAVAHLMPTFWMNEAITTAIGAPSLSADVLSRVGVDIGLTVLIACAIAAVGLAVGHVRQRERSA